MPPSISVVIPTLNEATFLPDLLDDLTAQTVPILEVLVADAGSRDETVALAGARGARIVPGGHPAVGRNAGADAARGDWLLFLDADIRLAPDAVEVALREMDRDRVAAASTWFVPDRGGLALRLGHWLSAWYFRTSSRLRWPHSIGAFLLLPKAVHEEIGGFDTSIRVAEDQDYVRRVARIVRYGLLRRPVITISTRRFETEGGLGTSAKWLAIELHRALRGEIRGDYFRYFK